ncbi:MAG: uncharacterized BrkB/YihY/UPF0761 family membrane protein [Candidatus Aldehydirespiratoraceae bacterium]|jgi:uncharacterized BrkB/YihY/UPF0761 family membrane protein
MTTLRQSRIETAVARVEGHRASGQGPDASDQVTLSSAGVAFFGFTAIIPMLATTVSIYGLTAAPGDLTSLVSRIRGTAPPEVADMLQQQLKSVTSSNSGALGVDDRTFLRSRLLMPGLTLGAMLAVA